MNHRASASAAERATQFSRPETPFRLASLSRWPGALSGGQRRRVTRSAENRLIGALVGSKERQFSSDPGGDRDSWWLAGVSCAVSATRSTKNAAWPRPLGEQVRTNARALKLSAALAVRPGSVPDPRATSDGDFLFPSIDQRTLRRRQLVTLPTLCLPWRSSSRRPRCCWWRWRRARRT